MSCEFTVGHQKLSSRVLKPPGGSSTDFFTAGENNAPKPRPKYDQQNSSNLNFVMNTVDPNVMVQNISHSEEEEHHAEAPQAKSEQDGGQAPSTPPKSNGNADAKEDAKEAASPSNDNLPKYHHYRSTNFW